MDAAGGRNPESYTWPLLAGMLVILPQALIPAGNRVGPPLLVPLIEGAALLVLVGIAARPGPVPRGARSVVLTLFCVLAVANATAAARLVTLVLDGDPVDGVPLTAARILVATALVLLTNVVTFGLLYRQVDGGGPTRRVAEPPPFPALQFPQALTEGLAPREEAGDDLGAVGAASIPTSIRSRSMPGMCRVHSRSAVSLAGCECCSRAERSSSAPIPPG